MIATTNLTKNLDSAFERRFLYKIEFEKPEVETRKAIWRSLIIGLSGKTPSLEDMIKFCDEESLGKEALKRIGFIR